MKRPTLNWNDRFAVIDHFTPTDVQIQKAFCVTQDELATARTLRTNGTFAPNASLNAAKYSHLFNQAGGTATTQTTSEGQGIGNATVHTKPETATKKVKVPQKRGRKGNRIEMALRAITTTPVPVDMFMKQHNVSLAVLRQSKRFIETLGPVVAAEIGTINVRQDKISKQLVVWKRA